MTFSKSVSARCMGINTNDIKVTVFAGGIAIQNTSWTIWFWQLGSCVLAIPFVYFMCPETGGRTLEQIDLIFMDNDAADHLAESPHSDLTGAADDKDAMEKDDQEYLEKA